MEPIVIPEKVINRTNRDLVDKLHRLSYTFCVRADFNNVISMDDLIKDLESHIMEAMLRICYSKFGFRPFQNKFYEKVEHVFGYESQDTYNINRGMSSLRRTKKIEIDTTDTQYISWMKNRIRYGVKSINNVLNEIENTVQVPA